MLNTQQLATLEQFLSKKKLLSPTPRFHLQQLIRLKLKRRLRECYVMLLYQSIATFFLVFNQAAIPLYPPTAMAFILIYLSGSRAIPGVFLGGFLGYLANNFELMPGLVEISIDIACGSIGALICRKMISSDVMPLFQRTTLMKFILLSAFLISPMATLLRIYLHGDILGINLLQTISLWFSHLNALMIIAGYLLTWLYKPKLAWSLSSLKDWRKPVLYFALACTLILLISKYPFALLGLLLILPIHVWIIAEYGYLAGSASLFVIGLLYVVHFILANHHYHQQWDQTSQLYLFGFVFMQACVTYYMPHLTTVRSSIVEQQNR